MKQLQQPCQHQDYDGKVYDQLSTGQVIRRSPKMRGKDRRLARAVARMMEQQEH